MITEAEIAAGLVLHLDPPIRWPIAAAPTRARMNNAPKEATSSCARPSMPGLVAGSRSTPIQVTGEHRLLQTDVPAIRSGLAARGTGIVTRCGPRLMRQWRPPMWPA